MPKGVYQRKRTIIQRFMGKVGPATVKGCREWRGAIGKNGYGVFRFQGKNLGAHAAAATAYYGQVPVGKIVCHHCDNKICVNPAHLYIGTYQKNTHDALKRGLFMASIKVRLFPEEIEEIKTSPLSNRKIARQLGINYHTVGAIRSGLWPLVKV